MLTAVHCVALPLSVVGMTALWRTCTGSSWGADRPISRLTTTRDSVLTTRVNAILILGTVCAIRAMSSSTILICRASLLLQGSPPSGKPLIPLERRDVGVVVRLPGEAAPARHLAVARDGLKRERRRMKEHAWKAIRAKRIEQHGNASRRNRFNDFPLQNAPRCDDAHSGVHRWL